VQPLILEVFDRNQKWALKAHPLLSNLSANRQPVDRNRIIKTFDATKVSQRLIMFHVYFLKNIAKPRGKSVHDVMRMYDDYYGRPTQRMKFDLQLATKEFQTINNWIEFFKKIDMQLPTPRRLNEWLKESVINSQRKRYHRRSDFADLLVPKKKKEKADVDKADSFDDFVSY